MYVPMDVMDVKILRKCVTNVLVIGILIHNVYVLMDCKMMESIPIAQVKK